MPPVPSESINRDRFPTGRAAIIALGLLSGLVYLSSYYPGNMLPGIAGSTGVHSFLVRFALLSVCYLAGVFLVCGRGSSTGGGRMLVGVILIFGVVFRLSLVPATPILSSDVYRYLWDGRVQEAGVNPYRHPPEAEELIPLRDDVLYPNINRRDFPTIYPAGAQLFFKLFYTLGGRSITAFKGAMAVFDSLTLVVLLALLRAHGVREERVLVYAWNPLVIYEIAHSGHLEGLTVFLVVLAFFLHSSGREMPGVASLALAGSLKLYPALLLPALVNRGRRIKGLAIFAVIGAALYLPYLSAGDKVAGFLPRYFKNPYESFNLGLKYFIMHLFPELDYYLLTKIFLLALAAAGVLVFFRAKPRGQAVRQAYFLIGALIILMPAALHPWYVVWLIPFLAFYPSPAWLIFSCTVAASYLKYVSPGGGFPRWVLLLEYLPLYTLLAGGYLLQRYAELKRPAQRREAEGI
jgi:hypothetical protein